SGARLTQYPGFPTQEDAHARIQEALPYLPYIRNTSASWALRVVLADLYDWHEPITADNWRRLDALIRERAADPAWPYSILDRLNIQRTGAEYARRGAGVDDERLQYALEWAFFTRSQWGEYDTALYELERCWGRLPESPTPIGGGKRPATERVICTLDDVHAALAHFMSVLPYDQILAYTTHLSTDIDYRVVSDGEMQAALTRRAQAGPEERNIYASYINEAFLTALEAHADQIMLQFSFGAEPLPYETSSRLYQRSIVQLAEMCGRHPKLRFQCFLASRHTNQSLCTLVRELPNLSLSGYWWHNFYPDTIRQVMYERLDMVPTNKQVGFFSDAYCVEWCYGKAIMVRKQMANVLAQKIKDGQYTRDDALAVARAILYETPQSLVGMVPRKQ
ncbi:MAG: hypothetical protein IT324_01335, partial [Anaerolineae bacterium]|nr:hypothetical protein [Anaerolineae bacterium]